MKNGIWFAIVPHTSGSVLAVVLAWYLPTWVPIFNSVLPAQYALAIVATAWSLWKLYEILADKDKLARKTAEHFDGK